LIFTETPIPGAYVIELEPNHDERGWFARMFDRDEFEKRGLNPEVVQSNVSYSEHAGTLRGLHWQEEPHGETKLIRCSRGAIFDVIVDLRRDSSAYRRWHGVDLTPESGCMLYVPTGIANGFQTLADQTEAHYQMGHHYVPESVRGVRWDDPSFAIEWPLPVTEISERDRSLPHYDPAGERTG
jgi:dTDP-4-dehydrorhamnose 3,5-epimerase